MRAKTEKQQHGVGFTQQMSVKYFKPLTSVKFKIYLPLRSCPLEAEPDFEKLKMIIMVVFELKIPFYNIILISIDVN